MFWVLADANRCQVLIQNIHFCPKNKILKAEAPMDFMVGDTLSGTEIDSGSPVESLLLLQSPY